MSWVVELALVSRPIPQHVSRAAGQGPIQYVFVQLVCRSRHSMLSYSRPWMLHMSCMRMLLPRVTAVFCWS